jgi:hypothetical protein
VYTNTGAFEYTIGGPGTGDGAFNSPEGVAFSGSTLYIADEGNNLIQAFTPGTTSAAFLTQWGGVGTGNGLFSGPVGVGVDVNGDVYVADSGNNLIQEFSPAGGFITQFDGVAAGAGGLNSPAAWRWMPPETSMLPTPSTTWLKILALRRAHKYAREYRDQHFHAHGNPHAHPQFHAYRDFDAFPHFIADLGQYGHLDAESHGLVWIPSGRGWCLSPLTIGVDGSGTTYIYTTLLDSGSQNYTVVVPQTGTYIMTANAGVNGAPLHPVTVTYGGSAQVTRYWNLNAGSMWWSSPGGILIVICLVSTGAGIYQLLAYGHA